MTTLRLNHFINDIDISSNLYNMVQRIDAAADKARLTFSTWVSRTDDRRQLASLSDRMLEDIGLTRVEVLAEADKYFWQR